MLAVLLAFVKLCSGKGGNPQLWEGPGVSGFVVDGSSGGLGEMSLQAFWLSSLLSGCWSNQELKVAVEPCLFPLWSFTELITSGHSHAYLDFSSLNQAQR